MKLRENTKITFIVLGLIIGSVCITLPFMFSGLKIETVFQVLLWILGYALLIMEISYFTEKCKNKLFKQILFVFSIPFHSFFLILSLIQPTLVLLFNASILFMVSFGIPFILFNFLNLGLKTSTTLFLCISIASILSVYASKYLLKIIFRFSPVMMDTIAEKPQNKYLKELTALFYQKSNIIFCIYFFYLVYIAVMSFIKIQCNQPVFRNDIDLAILQSFLVFIAFTNMLLKSKDVQLAPKSILRLYAKIIFGDVIKEKSENCTIDDNSGKADV